MQAGQPCVSNNPIAGQNFSTYAIERNIWLSVIWLSRDRLCTILTSLPAGIGSRLSRIKNEIRTSQWATVALTLATNQWIWSRLGTLAMTSAHSNKTLAFGFIWHFRLRCFRECIVFGRWVWGALILRFVRFWFLFFSYIRSFYAHSTFGWFNVVPRFSSKRFASGIRHAYQWPNVTGIFAFTPWLGRGVVDWGVDIDRRFFGNTLLFQCDRLVRTQES